ncbi:T9SS type A sorting domain-containing protein [candidate division WOR-3 bacterium]|nr:T9SS type A sorting domain-containing protein [candidate division WOR-3 bacterium]
MMWFLIALLAYPFKEGFYRAGVPYEIERRDREKVIIYEGESVLPACRKYPLPPSVTDSIWYDDGESGGGLALGACRAVRFTPPFYPFKVDGTKYCLHPTGSENPHILHFYQGDSGGAPDSIPVDLITPIIKSGLSEGWHYEDILDSEAVITSGDLYVAIASVPDSPRPAIIYDAGPSHIYDRYWKCDETEPPFHWYEMAAFTLLIRAYGEIAYHTDYNVQPLKIVYPTGWDYPDSEVVPQVIVRNFGDSSATNFNVIYRIDSSGIPVYNETQTVTKVLEPLIDTVFITFPSWTTGQEDNIYDISFYTSWFLDTLNEYDTLKMRDTTKYLVKVGELEPDSIAQFYSEGLTWDGTHFWRLVVWDMGEYYLTKVYKIDSITAHVDTSFWAPCNTATAIAYALGDLWIVGDDTRKIHRLHRDGELVNEYPLIPQGWSQALLWDEDLGKFLYFAAEERDSGYLYILDTLCNIVDSTFTGGMIDFASDGAYISANKTIWLPENYPTNLIKKFVLEDNKLIWKNQYDVSQSFPPDGYGDCVSAISFDGQYLWMGGWNGKKLRKYKIYGVQGIEESDGRSQITDVRLLQNYPNPFSQKTEIRYQIADVNKASLRIYDLAGRLVKSFPLVTNHLSLTTAVSWDGRDNNGEKVASGVYFYKLRVGEKQTITKKAILLR